MSERTCIATGKTLARHHLLRFVAGPDGAATLDLAEKLPGRGAWIIADRTVLREAVKKGHFKRTIDAFCGDIEVEIERVKDLLRRRVIARASMARRAGLLVGGSGKLIAGCEFIGLIVAPDASQREAQRLHNRLGVTWSTTCLLASEIGQIFGRESLAFAGLRAPSNPSEENLCRNLHQEISRMEGFYIPAGCNLQPDGCIT